MPSHQRGASFGAHPVLRSLGIINHEPNRIRQQPAKSSVSALAAASRSGDGGAHRRWRYGRADFDVRRFLRDHFDLLQRRRCVNDPISRGGRLSGYVVELERKRRPERRPRRGVSAIRRADGPPANRRAYRQHKQRQFVVLDKQFDSVVVLGRELARQASDGHRHTRLGPVVERERLIRVGLRQFVFDVVDIQRLIVGGQQFDVLFRLGRELADRDSDGHPGFYLRLVVELGIIILIRLRKFIRFDVIGIERFVVDQL
jgi:hypothetical protein